MKFFSFEIYFSTLKHEAIFDSSIHWKTSLYHQGTTIWGILPKKWKAYWSAWGGKLISFLKGEKNQENTNHFALSSNKTLPTILELKPFEEDALKLLENIKFRDTKNHFQENLANDLKKINSSDKIFVFADKTRNIYETSLDTYNKILHDNITKTYKHGSEDNISEINNEIKHIADKLSIGNRIECMKKRKAFISLKDHKENFENNPKNAD